MAKAKAAIPNPESSATTAIPIRVLKIGTCPSLSGKSTLTYHIGCTTDNDIRIRLAGNTGGGFFNDLWFSLADIQKLLANVPSGKTITSAILNALVSGRSVNTPSFVFGVLLHEGLVQPAKEKKRCYELTTAAAAKFFDDVKALIASEVNLKVPEKSVKVAKTIAKSPRPEATPVPVAAIPSQQFESISKHPWPIKKKASKAAPKKA